MGNLFYCIKYKYEFDIYKKKSLTMIAYILSAQNIPLITSCFYYPTSKSNSHTVSFFMHLSIQYFMRWLVMCHLLCEMPGFFPGRQ